MKIGEDYEKMEFTFMNLELLEPNALLTDGLIAIVGVVISFIVLRQNKKITSPFFKYWYVVFLAYGVGFFFGGMGHVFFNYTGVVGKYFALFGGFIITAAIEHAMISLLPEKRKLYLVSKVKALLAVVAITFVLFTAKEENMLKSLLLVPSLNSLVGMIFCGVIAWKLAKKTTKALYLIPLTIVVMIPAAVFQTMKINLHPWFDRNDVGHLLIITVIIMYYFAVKGYRKYLLGTSTS